MLGRAGRREGAGHCKQYHLLAVEQVAAGDRRRAVIGHLHEAAFGHLVANLDSHFSAPPSWISRRPVLGQPKRT
jgi:hypothetical protein